MNPEDFHVTIVYVGPTPLVVTLFAVIVLLTVWAWWRIVRS